MKWKRVRSTNEKGRILVFVELCHPKARYANCDLQLKPLSTPRWTRETHSAVLQTIKNEDEEGRRRDRKKRKKRRGKGEGEGGRELPKQMKAKACIK